MRLTTKSRYGTRLLLDLAIYSKKEPVRLSDVSKRQGISLKYLEKLIRNLKQAGYVKSIRGPYGGYMLAKPTKEISVGDIVRIMEDSQTITDCTEKENVCGVCTQAGECLSQWIWMETAKAMFEKLDSFKIDKLLTSSTKILKKKSIPTKNA
ncbi:MAG: Rrf2 family transcriptional regulator [Deltaproteobacteria bacterium]|nr:Rrf2 family transcriptional regulator [Deltaproteobacteria bacterium]MBW2181594.1 Rrf2 family transcriptional regulator [Deltaproteobacteria bacterium]